MPIYDFKCQDSACGEITEKMTPSSIDNIECPHCGGRMLRMVSGSQSFYFKGEGVYCEKSPNPRKQG